MDITIQAALASRFAELTGARSASVTACALLSGGTIQQNWRFDLSFDGGDLGGPLEAVLRTDSDATLSASLTRAQEYALFKVAFAAGVCVPEPLFLLEDNPLGRALFLMRRVTGSAHGHRLVKSLPTDAPELCRTLGHQLATIHAITPPMSALEFLGDAPHNPALASVKKLRDDLDALEATRPALELGLYWLEVHAPAQQPISLCHNDYRTGNYMVEGGLLTGVLDWEFAGWGCAMQDVGWFTAPCWRFGANERVAGGIGSLNDFIAGYEQESSQTLPLDELHYWQCLATVRWAVIALAQAERHRSGVEPSLELALTYHVVPELECDVLELIDG